MTEAEWQTCEDAGDMLDLLRSRGLGSERKLRLFCCACCRLAWSQLPGRVRQGVEAAERFADGLADERALQSALDTIRGVRRKLRQQQGIIHVSQRAMNAASWAAGSRVDFEAARSAAWEVTQGTWPETRPMQVRVCAVLRHLFGDPFRPCVADPVWLAWEGGTIPALAAALCEEKTHRPERAGILADALDDAGCADDRILAHLRDPATVPHLRGCWVVDLLTGRV